MRARASRFRSCQEGEVPRETKGYGVLPFRTSLRASALKARSLGDRLKVRRAEKGMSQHAVAAAAEIPLESYKKYEGDKITPGTEALVSLARALNVALEWLATGTAPKERGGMAQLSAARDAATAFIGKRSSVPPEKVPEILEIAFDRQLDADGLEREFGRMYPAGAVSVRQPVAAYEGDQFVQIPLYDIRAAAGKGELVPTENPIDALAFKRDWIRQEVHANPNDLRLIYVEGDSMEPDLRAGDIILVDHTDTHARREGIYVILLDGALLVKILQRLPGGVIRVISRNESYEPFSIKVQDLDGEHRPIVIVGRVVWQCRRW